MKSILKKRNGQSLVEFALVVPMLILLVCGIAEFGRAWMTKNILTGAAREASRIAVVRAPYGGYGNAVSRADNILSSAAIPLGGGTGAIVTICLNGTCGQAAVEDTNLEFGTVTTTVTYNLPAVTPILQIITSGGSGGYGTIPLSSTTTMRREY